MISAKISRGKYANEDGMARSNRLVHNSRARQLTQKESTGVRSGDDDATERDLHDQLMARFDGFARRADGAIAPKKKTEQNFLFKKFNRRN